VGPGNQDFLGPVKWHRAVRFGAQKSRDEVNLLCPGGGWGVGGGGGGCGVGGGGWGVGGGGWGGVGW
jgi:hypothetical protein